MEDIVNLINSAITVSTATDYPSAFAGNWFLFGLAMFIDLFSCLLGLLLIFNNIRSIFITRKFTHFLDPINMYKYIILLFALTISLRTCMDATILLTWGELSFERMRDLNDLDRMFDISSIIPFLGFIYLILKGGPVIEFQLLRQPIPSDLFPTWIMLRKPVLSFVIVMILCVIITLSK